MSDHISEKLVRRSLRDTNNIAKIAIRAAVRIAGKIRARYLEEFRTGIKFQARDYVISQYKPILVNTLLASHLAGFRRTYLMFRQIPSLQRKLEEQQTLELSELTDALKVLQRKTELDVNALQRKYNTQALKVLSDASEDIEKSLQIEFKALIEEGATVNESIRRLGEKFDELGLSPRRPHVLESIFRTQLQMTFAAGRYQAEQDSDIQEILWGYKYVTTGDDRVREEHEILEGTTLPKDDPFWDRFYPPNGWNCRCQVIPIFETRDVVKAPDFDTNGNRIAPDKGFDFNPGKVFN